MPRRKHLKKKSGRKQRRRPRKSSRRPRRAGIGKALKAHAQMLANPCGATLIPGMFSSDEGMLTRLKSAQNGTGAGTSGYFLWFPRYVGDAVNGSANCIFFSNTDSSVAPLNTSAFPYADNDGSATNGTMFDTGASAFVQSDTVSDFRTVSACMKTTYTGAMTDSKGMVATITNVSVDALLRGNSDAPLSVDQLFAMSADVHRLGVDTQEVRYRPDPQLNDFTNDRTSAYDVGSGATTAMSHDSARFFPTCIGFAWIGVDTSSLNFQFVQNIEWRPDALVGINTVVPRMLSDPGHTGRVLRWLDNNIPSWQSAGKRLLGYGLRTAVTALTGVPPLPSNLITVD